jgi:hypothetical protein
MKRKDVFGIPLESIAKKLKPLNQQSNSKKKQNQNKNTQNRNKNKKNLNHNITNEQIIPIITPNTISNKLQHLRIPGNKYTKEQIPKRIRELVWSTYNGKTYSSKCFVSWCNNEINVFNYQVGHDVPESKGGTMDVSNLRPICGNCNLSMGNKYTIQEWSKLIEPNLAILQNQTIEDQTSENQKENTTNTTNTTNTKKNQNKKLENKNIHLPPGKLSLIAVLVIALNIILF